MSCRCSPSLATLCARWPCCALLEDRGLVELQVCSLAGILSSVGFLRSFRCGPLHGDLAIVRHCC